MSKIVVLKDVTMDALEKAGACTGDKSSFFRFVGLVAKHYKTHPYSLKLTKNATQEQIKKMLDLAAKVKGGYEFFFKHGFLAEVPDFAVGSKITISDSSWSYTFGASGLSSDRYWQKNNGSKHVYTVIAVGKFAADMSRKSSNLKASVVPVDYNDLAVWDGKENVVRFTSSKFAKLA